MRERESADGQPQHSCVLWDVMGRGLPPISGCDGSRDAREAAVAPPHAAAAAPPNPTARRAAARRAADVHLHVAGGRSASRAPGADGPAASGSPPGRGRSRPHPRRQRGRAPRRSSSFRSSAHSTHDRPPLTTAHWPRLHSQSHHEASLGTESETPSLYVTQRSQF